MKINELLKHFGGNAPKPLAMTIVAGQLRCSRRTVEYWVQNKRIPPVRQLAIEAVTSGKLKADR